MEPGVSDSTVLTRANDARALSLTEDKDFGELVFRQRRVHAGVLLTRLAGLAAAAKGDLLVQVLAEHEEELQGAFVVISPGAVRIAGVDTTRRFAVGRSACCRSDWFDP